MRYSVNYDNPAPVIEVPGPPDPVADPGPGDPPPPSSSPPPPPPANSKQKAKARRPDDVIAADKEKKTEAYDAAIEAMKDGRESFGSDWLRLI